MNVVPFNLTSLYLVLVNPAGGHEIWPAFCDVPPDWKASLGASPRELCLAHIRSLYTGDRLPDAA